MEKLLYTNVKVITKLRQSFESRSPFLVKADVGDELAYSGFLKAYDPLTKSVILCHIKNDIVTENIIILGHTIESVVSHDQIDQDQILHPSKTEKILIEDILNKCRNNSELESTKLSNEDIRRRRSEIVEWLTKNRIPVKIEDTSSDILIVDDIRVQSPYENISDYKCPTRIILKRIKNIIDSRNKHRIL